LTFAASLRRHGQIILALLQREEHSRKNNPAESVLDLLEPVLLIGLISFAWWFLGTKNASPLGGSPVLFYATGFFAKYFFIYLSRRMRGSIESPRRRFPVEQRLDYIVVHIILRVIDYSILGVLVFGTIYFFFSADAYPADMPNVIEACAAIVMLGFGWGMLNLVLMKIFWVWIYLFPAINRSLVIFSGVFFLADFLAPSVRYALSFNPMLHTIMLFRMGFYPHYPTLVFDRRYMWACAIGALLFGLMIERVTRRQELR
jgi:capsular polysaccharide transport system permease protein